MSEWLFGPDSMMWKINREWILLLGGRGALLMQLAHPLVAAGVHEHSDFNVDAFGRLRRTLDAMLTIIFGDVATAREVAARVRKIHSRVEGRAIDGRWYSALDPKLLLWVHCTLTDSSIRVYEAFVAPLSDAEKDAYYAECQVVGSLFGIPDDQLLPSLEAMREWMTAMIDSGEVHVTEPAREIAAGVLNPFPLMPGGLVARADFITPALLPRRIREGYGLKMGRPAAVALRLGRGATRRMLPLLPERVRVFPPARLVRAVPGLD